MDVPQSSKEEDLRSTGKRKSVTEAKSAFGYLAIKKMGYSGREIGRFSNMRSYSAIRRTQEGKKVIGKSEFLWDLFEEQWNSGNVPYYKFTTFQNSHKIFYITKNCGIYCKYSDKSTNVRGLEA